MALSGNQVTQLGVSGYSQIPYFAASNLSPTNITISSSSILVTAADGAVLGTLTVTDPDVGDTHAFTLVAGTGDTNNADVAVDLNTGVVTVNSAATLGVGSYSFRVQADDGESTPYEKAVVFSVIAAADVAVLSSRLTIGIGIHI